MANYWCEINIKNNENVEIFSFVFYSTPSLCCKMRKTVRIIKLHLTTLLWIIFQIQRNCSSVQSIFEDAEKISALQRDMDQIMFQRGIVSTFSDDVGSEAIRFSFDIRWIIIFFQPTFITFGEYPVDTTFVKEMQRSQDLLNFLRLLQEQYPDSWRNRYACLSENDRCPKRPAYTCARLFLHTSVLA